MARRCRNVERESTGVQEIDLEDLRALMAAGIIIGQRRGDGGGNRLKTKREGNFDQRREKGVDVVISGVFALVHFLNL